MTVERHEGKTHLFQIGGKPGALPEMAQQEKNNEQEPEKGDEKDKDPSGEEIYSLEVNEVSSQQRTNKGTAYVPEQTDTEPKDMEEETMHRQDPDGNQIEDEPEGEIGLDGEEEEKTSPDAVRRTPEPKAGGRTIGAAGTEAAKCVKAEAPRTTPGVA